ncbi:unnamed protein product [Spirodela intermedia]|uniref:Uncharacterized protein n=1 Tax=Spirodela intermedia TaxID=51605 RepID=A0A7I8JTL4_SPIIN|nr:unnamed protein product [Spirodela intermedia]CAA6673101.1 unnamed protein product [Spirodela intermedia]
MSRRRRGDPAAVDVGGVGLEALVVAENLAGGGGGMGATRRSSSRRSWRSSPSEMPSSSDRMGSPPTCPVGEFPAGRTSAFSSGHN